MELNACSSDLCEALIQMRSGGKPEAYVSVTFRALTDERVS
jgi:hypothetical protein